jgi:hypothetical protein
MTDNNSLCVITPILPHKIGNVKDLVDDMCEKNRGDMEQYMRQIGIKKAMGFIQAMQVGDFFVEYLEMSGDIKETMEKAESMKTPFLEYGREKFKEISGMERSEMLKNVQKTEKLYDWKDSKLFLEERDTLKMPWVWATPILPGKTEDVRRFWKTRREEHAKDAEEHFKNLDIVSMQAYLQHLPQGDFLVQYMCATEQLDKVMLKCMGADSKSSKFARSEYMKFSGIDFTKEDNLPDLQLVFSWNDVQGFQTAAQEIAYTQ